MRIGRFGSRRAGGLSISSLWAAFSRFRFALQGQRRALFVALLASFVVAALEILKPWPIQVVLDHALTSSGNGGRWGLSTHTILVGAVLAIVLISFLSGVLSERSKLATAQVGRKVTTRIRRHVFEHLHRLALPFHQSSRTGDLVVRLMGDVNVLRDLMYGTGMTILERGVLLIGTTIVMTIVEPVLAILVLLPLPLVGLKLATSSRRLKKATRTQRRREGDAASFATETLHQIRIVKAYAGESAATERFADEARSGERAGMKAVRITARMERMTELLSGIGLALVLYVGGRRVMAGHLSLGELVVFISYARALYKPVRKISSEGLRIGKAAASAERLMDLLAIPAEDDRQGQSAPRFRGEIVFENVRYTYPTHVTAVDGLSFKLPARSFAMMTGPNGSGKSTVLAILLRLLPPDEGAVTIDGVPIDSFRLSSYRRRFAYVPQDIQLFGGTIRENILYGRPNASREEIDAAARCALFDEVVDRIPGGYDAILGENGATLSGGEARRLMLARAALRDAAILLFDEPLAGVDAAARPVVAAALRRVTSGRTAIVVSHGPASELAPDLVLPMRLGRIEVPPPAETPPELGVAASVGVDR